MKSSLRVEADFDWKNPDYIAVFQARANRLRRIRAGDVNIEALKVYYREHPADFINDWGMTVDPRNLDIDLPATVPFILFDAQREWIDVLMRKWKERKPLITEKSRDMGLSWLMVATAATLCIFRDGMQVGFGSRKEEYVDEAGQPKSLFWKAREFLEKLPKEFRGGWDRRRDAHMRITFPGTRAFMTGEAGAAIGRGDRTAIYFVDESAHLQHPEAADMALSQTTNCRVDVSSVNGMGNPFAQKRHGGKVEVFTFHWRQDPRKSQEWYDKLSTDQGLDDVVIAQEVDIDYAASAEGVLIPSKWIQSAIGAHIQLGFNPTGAWRGGFDIADGGKDKCALVLMRGILVDVCEEWPGINGDLLPAVEKVFGLCDEVGCKEVAYDADGVGSQARGDARSINQKRPAAMINFTPFQGSGAVLDPDGELMMQGRPNIDTFANRKAQAWWELRGRFRNTYRAVVEKKPYKEHELISISPKLKGLEKLQMELSQPTWSWRPGDGKMLIDKAPDGTKSPNKADGLMIASAKAPGGLVVSESLLARSRMAGGRRLMYGGAR